MIFWTRILCQTISPNGMNAGSLEAVTSAGVPFDVSHGNAEDFTMAGEIMSARTESLTTCSDGMVGADAPASSRSSRQCSAVRRRPAAVSGIEARGAKRQKGFLLMRSSMCSP